MDITKYLSVPYVPHGCGFSGADCWGLVRLWLMHEAGLNLPDYKYAAGGEAAEIAKHMHEGFRRVEAPVRGDIVLLSSRHGAADHLGVVVGAGEFLHTSEKFGTVVSNINRWRDRIYGFYRYTPDYNRQPV